MPPSRQSKEADQADSGRPGQGDPVLTALRHAAEEYRAMYELLQQRIQATVLDLNRARNDDEVLREEITAKQRELDQQRSLAERQRDTSQALAAALKDIHRSLFSGNVYELILKACLTLTGATRGLYVTTTGENDDVHIRAAVDMDNYPASPPSRLILALTRVALHTQEVRAYHDTSALPDEPREGESFGNCLTAPVVLRNDLSGVVIVADKAGGGFDEADADVLLSVGSHAAVAIENNRLQREVHDAYLSIVTLLAGTIAARSRAAEPRDDLPSRLATVVAERVGLPEYDRSIVYYAALLRDVGIVGVSDGVLNKPGPLLDEERDLIRAHVQIGHDLLRRVPVLSVVADIVRHHHERYAGDGYPDRLRGEEIPMAARIVAVVDAYFAMLSRRSYRLPLSTEQACEELRRGSGSQFDPRVVDAFLAVLADTTTNAGVDVKSIEVSIPGLAFAASD